MSEMNLNKLTKEELIARLEAAEAANKPANEVINNDPNRRVRITLFKDNGRYSEPLPVSVNDYNAVIKRGVPVDVPYFVAKHLEEVAAQDQATASMIGRMTAEWGSNAKKL